MSLAHVQARHVRLVFGYSLRHALRSGSGLVFLMLAFFTGLTVAQLIVSPFESFVVRNQDAGLTAGPEAAERMLVGMARPLIEWAVSPREIDDPEAQSIAREQTDRWVTYLLEERPAIFSAVLLVLMYTTPFLAPVAGFNQTSGDIGSRGLRYLLLRTERANIYYGRLLATMALTVVVQVLVVTTIAVYLGLRLPFYGGMDLFLWCLQGLLAVTFWSVPYVALSAWISASQDSALASLVICNAAIGGVLLGAWAAAAAWAPAYRLEYLLPWGVQHDLLSPDWSAVGLTAAACLLYALAFTWLGARRFESRDL